MTEMEWMHADEGARSWWVSSMPPRRQRLLAAACCRSVHSLLTEPTALPALEAVEMFADTGKSKAALKRHRKAVRAVRLSIDAGLSESGHTRRQRITSEMLWAVEEAACENAAWGAVADAGRASAIETDNPHAALLLNYRLYTDIMGAHQQPVAFDAGWRTSTAVALARQMYDVREFDLLPVLADALEEAGCDAADLLAHCRGPGPHVRGCWAVDLVLGKT